VALHALTIDLEDWHHLVGRRTGAVDEPGADVLRQTDIFLRLCADHDVKATFFVMGQVATRFPALIRQIAAAGHEIASHGYAHLLAHRLSPQEFAQDAKRAKDVLESITGAPVSGYRAAEFSIGPRNMWALEELAALGYVYDSSIYPIRHRRYGYPGFDPDIVEYELASGARITEMPLATVVIGGVRMPVAGGGYFRLLPQSGIHRAFSAIHRAGRSGITYFHPYEFDTQPLKAAGVSQSGTSSRLYAARTNLLQNLGRTSVPGKLRGVLRTLPFSTCKEVLSESAVGRRRAVLR
jgi:polysaccharide deacetylase family protein (PEP-CTERM system associated)